MPTLADTSVCGPITTDTTWNLAGSPYVVTCDVDVTNGYILTIQSGVVVKFNTGTALIVNGTLISTGATFTSSRPSPVIGDWKHILFTASSQDAIFDTGGNYVSGSKLQGNDLTGRR